MYSTYSDSSIQQVSRAYQGNNARKPHGDRCRALIIRRAIGYGDVFNPP